MDTELAARFAAAVIEKRDAAKKIDKMSDEIAEMERELIGQFEAEGVQSVKVGGRTIYLNRKLWAGYKFPDGASADEKVKCKTAFMDAMKADAEWAWLVNPNYNASQLSSLVRELEERSEAQDLEDIPIPEGIKPHLSLSEKFNLGVRKS